MFVENVFPSQIEMKQKNARKYLFASTRECSNENWHTCTHFVTCVIVKAGFVEFAHVELQADDGKHEDGEEKKQANLQQRNHGLHDRFEHHL